MTIALDFTNVQTLGGHIPAGKYLCSIAALKPKKASTGKQMLEWRFQVEEGKYSGRILFLNTILTKDALWRTKEVLIAAGIAPEELEGEFSLNPEEIIGSEVMVAATVSEYLGQERNEVGRVTCVDIREEQPVYNQSYQPDDDAVGFAELTDEETATLLEGVEDNSAQDTDLPFDEAELSEIEPEEPETAYRYEVPEGFRGTKEAVALMHEHQIRVIVPASAKTGMVSKRDVLNWLERQDVE